MPHAALFVAHERIQLYSVNAVEDSFFCAGRFRLQRSDEILRALSARIGFARGGECTAAGEEGECVFLGPRENITLLDAVKWADQFHPRIVVACAFRTHSLQLTAVEHSHQCGFNHVVEVMPQCDLITPQLLRLRVEMSAPHSCTEEARMFFLLVHHRQNICSEYFQRNAEIFCIFNQQCAVFVCISRIHQQKAERERMCVCPCQLLHQQREQHGILAAGYTDSDFVARFDEGIGFYGVHKRIPQLFVEIRGDGLQRCFHEKRAPFEEKTPPHLNGGVSGFRHSRFL